MFDFRSPLFLILLSLIPIVVLLQLRTSVIAANWRKLTTFLIRCVILLCTILALANLQRINSEQRLALVFLLDTSDSIPKSQHEVAIEQISTAIAKLKSTDQFAVIGFAEESSVIIPMGKVDKQPPLTSVLMDPSGQVDSTNIVSALKRALEQIPNGYQERIVLFSDGIHNSGDISIAEFLPFFSAGDVEIMSIPLDSIQDAIRVEELLLPNKVRKGQRFPIQAIIKSDGTITHVKATLYHNSIPMPDLEFTLQNGRNVITLPTQQVWENHPQTYQLKLNTSDEIIENNQAFGVVQVQDKPQLLYADSDMEHSSSLKQVLEESGFVVKAIPANEIPTNLVSLQQYDVTILSNISTEMITDKQQEIIESYVKDLGHGLVVIGGDNAFGAGGYTDTTLERILPVGMTPREQKESVALVFVIDTSGSMANYVGVKKKIELAIEAIRAGIRNMDTDDEAAIIGFDVNTHIVSPLTSNHDRLIKLVGRLKPTGGTAAMTKAVAEAVEMNRTADVKRKHIILLSDGKSSGKRSEILEIAKNAANEQIGITTIAIGDADITLLKEIAETSKGRAIEVKNIQNLPKVLMNAVRETHKYIVQEEFQPIILSIPTPILEGINNIPNLFGYVATAEKDTAQVLISSHKKEPILAGWHYGLGKCVAWTSDVKPAWSKEFLPWSDFGKFWGQVVNWTLPAVKANADFDLIVTNRNGSGEIVINTKHSSPTSFVVQVAGPNGTAQSVDVEQKSTNRFIGSFQISDTGSYIVTAKREDDTLLLTETLTLSYPAEYTSFDVNVNLLRRFSAKTDGIYQPTSAQITAPIGTLIEKHSSLFQLLLIIAIILFVLEMIFRKFSIASGYFAELRGQIRRKNDHVVPDALTRLSQKKINVDTVMARDILANVSVAPPKESRLDGVTVDATIQQSETGGISRLLAAKRKSQSA